MASGITRFKKVECKKWWQGKYLFDPTGQQREKMRRIEKAQIYRSTNHKCNKLYRIRYGTESVAVLEKFRLNVGLGHLGLPNG